MSDLLTDRKIQITEKATALFRARGYAATSMRDLASAVGVEAASLYNHVRSKEALLHHICFGMADAFFSASRDVMHHQGDAEERLRLAIYKHVEVITSHRDAAAVFQHDWRYLSEPDLSVFKHQRDNYEHYFTQLLQDGVDAGLFRVADTKLTVMSMLSSLNWLYEWYRPDGALSPSQIAKHQADLFISGLKF